MPHERLDYFSALEIALGKEAVNSEEITAELRDHFTLRYDELREQGLSDDEAAAAALADFGDPNELAGAFGSIIRANRRRMIMRTTAWGIGSLSLALLGAFVLWPISSPQGAGVSNVSAQIPASAVTQALSAEEEAAQREIETNNTVTRLKLAKRSELQLENAPLGEALDLLSQKLQFEYHLDRQALEESGVTLEAPVSLKLKNARGDMLLKLLFQQVHRDLTYVVRDGIVFISFTGHIDELYEVRAYNVEDLADLTPHAGAAVPSISAEGEPNSGMYSALRNALQSTVMPETWRENGGGNGTVSELRNMIVVYQTPDVHERIASFLRLVREAQTKPAK